MKVLLVGSGAREHALAWKLNRSEQVSKLFFWPGAPAMGSCGQKLPYEGSSWGALAACAKQEGIDFVVVGPEQPLAEGFADQCQELGLPVFGPKQNAAQLESSKEFAKKVMSQADIPTARFKVVSNFDDCQTVALQMIADTGGAVIKASGLAAGKGVFVCTSKDDVLAGVERLKSSMAQAAERIVVEEILKGRECSFFCFVGRNKATPLGFAVDFKRLRDGDEGPNTGGMGCYTPVPWLPDDASERVMASVVNPLIEQLAVQGIEYTGCLYVGLMWGEQGPSVVEFNVRLGDPEAQVLALNDERDWGLMIAEKLGLVNSTTFDGTLPKNDRHSVAVVMAGEGYPYEKPKSSVEAFSNDLFDNDKADKSIFGASVLQDNEQLKPGGGRVLTVVQTAKSFAEARESVYGTVANISKTWPLVQFRKDIALRVSNEGEDS